MTRLQYMMPGFYRDTADNRHVHITMGVVKGNLELCVSKFVHPRDCLNHTLVDNPKFCASDNLPVLFYDEIKTHSCGGAYWHVHFPIQNDAANLNGNTIVSARDIDGRVSNQSNVWSVWVEQEFKAALEEKIAEEAKSTARTTTAEAFIKAYGNPLEEDSVYTKQETPFTLAYYLNKDRKKIFTITKPCCHVYGTDQEAMAFPGIIPQMEEKATDINALYPELCKIDLNAVRRYAAMIHQIQVMLVAAEVKDSPMLQPEESAEEILQMLGSTPTLRRGVISMLARRHLGKSLAPE